MKELLRTIPKVDELLRSESLSPMLCGSMGIMPSRRLSAKNLTLCARGFCSSRLQPCRSRMLCAAESVSVPSWFPGPLSNL